MSAYMQLMDPTVVPEWQQLALYAVAAALLILLLQRIPYVGRVVRFLFTFALLAFCIFLLMQQVPYQPTLSRIAEDLGLDRQEVVGKEIRIRMAPDGHFWANVTINGVERRMLIDSGATVTAISDETARSAGVGSGTELVPVVIRTASGVAPARTGTVEELRVGGITARNLKVVVSPALANLDVLGMNFLSKLESWRVEGRTLVLVPHERQVETSERS